MQQLKCLGKNDVLRFIASILVVAMDPVTMLMFMFMLVSMFIVQTDFLRIFSVLWRNCPSEHV